MIASYAGVVRRRYMTQSDTGQRGYSLPMRMIHWTMALIMISMILAGLAMVNGPWDGKFPPLRGHLYDYHRGMGFVLMVLVVLRLILRWYTVPPSPLPGSVAPLQRKAAGVTHFLLYTSLMVQPLLGWYATNTWGVKNITIFGIFDLPSIADKNRELGDWLLTIHGYIGVFIAGLVCMHIGAALMHQFVLKDNVLMRMLRT